MSKENKPEVNKQEQTQTLSEILQVRRDKLKYFQDEGRDPFKQTRFDRTAWSAEIKSSYEEFENKDVKVCGRIMAKRGMGKAIFCHIKDDRGQIQLYIRADAVSEQEFKDFRKYDIGDIIGVEGYVFKTKTEEITVHVSKVVLLSKSLRPLPEKFHGMTNIELKYRQRYVDLIMSDESRRNFEIRSKFISYILNENINSHCSFNFTVVCKFIFPTTNNPMVSVCYIFFYHHLFKIKFLFHV